VINCNYTVPKLGGNRWLREATGGWTFGGILRYASGSLIGMPGSSNALSSLLFHGTRMNRVPGEPLYTVDLNCRSCYDPRKDFVLNPKAWSDAPAGQFGYSAAYYNDYRNQRHPDEQLSLGRNFRVKERVTLSIRMEFFNVFNRLMLGGRRVATRYPHRAGMPTVSRSPASVISTRRPSSRVQLRVCSASATGSS
jgi:hypothetical protein